MRRISETVQWAAFQAGVEDSQGNEVEAWAVAVPVGVYAFDPGSTSEPRLPGQDRVIVEPTIYMPQASIFGAHDLVTVRGLLHEVVGVTREWRHPNGQVKGNVATLRRVDG